MPRWPQKAEGMEKSKQARKRKLDRAKTDLKPPLVLRRAGCPSSECRKMESEGPAEKYRAVIDREPQDKSVGQRWGKESRIVPDTERGVHAECSRHEGQRQTRRLGTALSDIPALQPYWEENPAYGILGEAMETSVSY